MDPKDGRYVSEDPIEDGAKQTQLDGLRSSLVSFMRSANFDDNVELVLQDITAEDVRQYLESDAIDLQEDEVPNAKVTGCILYDRGEIEEFLNSLRAHVSFPPQSLLFFVLESSNFASVVIPLNLDEKIVSVSIRPLESTPKYIKDIWWKRKGRNNQRNLEEILRNTPKLKRGF
jgi:hypothetical protein